MSGLADLRSDTVTRPTAAMRRAMAEAEVGDDMYGEDPTVRALEQRVAGMLGKDVAFFVPSGTMANQIALALHTRPGDAVFVPARAHCVSHESGAGPALSGVTFVELGASGLVTAEEVREAWHEPRYYEPNPSLVWLENTHNFSGGTPLGAGQLTAVVEQARRVGLTAHMDGARLWNAATALDTTVGELAGPFDSVSVCFSKGLGAPVGSAIAVGAAHAERARRIRKMLGGAMRQSGILAAAALHALDRHLPRLAEDHRRARWIADAVTASGVSKSVRPTSTNIVIIELHAPSASEVVARCAARDVLVAAMSPSTLRVVTHLDVNDDAAQRAGVTLIDEIRATAASERSPA